MVVIKSFEVLYRKQTTQGSNYFKLLVTLEDGTQVEARYFGNTVPKKISYLYQRGNYLLAAIQKHTSRDQQSGRFTSFRRKEA